MFTSVLSIVVTYLFHIYFRPSPSVCPTPTCTFVTTRIYYNEHEFGFRGNRWQSNADGWGAMTRKEHSLCSYCDVVVQGWDSNLSISLKHKQFIVPCMYGTPLFGNNIQWNLSILKLLSEDRKLESASELTARMNVLPVPNETRNTSVFWSSHYFCLKKIVPKVVWINKKLTASGHNTLLCKILIIISLHILSK